MHAYTTRDARVREEQHDPESCGLVDLCPSCAARQEVEEHAQAERFRAARQEVEEHAQAERFRAARQEAEQAEEERRLAPLLKRLAPFVGRMVKHLVQGGK